VPVPVNDNQRAGAAFWAVHVATILVKPRTAGQNFLWLNTKNFVRVGNFYFLLNKFLFFL
jgi:hypothetical protein